MGQFWIFAIVIGISVLSSVIGKMKEQAEINRAREAAKKRREEEAVAGQGPSAEEVEQALTAALSANEGPADSSSEGAGEEE